MTKSYPFLRRDTLVDIPFASGYYKRCLDRVRFLGPSKSFIIKVQFNIIPLFSWSLKRSIETSKVISTIDHMHK